MLRAGVEPNIYVFNALLAVLRSEIQECVGYQQKEALVSQAWDTVQVPSILNPNP